MIELGLQGRSEKFYFRSMSECNTFLNMFSTHSCSLPWLIPRIVSDNLNIAESDRLSLNEAPVKRAIDHLSWGFNIVQRGRSSDY